MSWRRFLARFPDLPCCGGIYRPRHHERTVLYWVLFHYFNLFSGRVSKPF
ncbi:MAG: hypothetical protein ACUVR0_06785 [Candidatus Aminicenantales bacterium]